MYKLVHVIICKRTLVCTYRRTCRQEQCCMLRAYLRSSYFSRVITTFSAMFCINCPFKFKQTISMKQLGIKFIFCLYQYHVLKIKIRDTLLVSVNIKWTFIVFLQFSSCHCHFLMAEYLLLMVRLIV